jgi:hypothetical protein
MNDADASHHHLIDPPWAPGAPPPESPGDRTNGILTFQSAGAAKSKGAKIMHKYFLAFTLLCALASTGLLCVLASTGALAHSGSDQEQKACTPDVQRFCRKLMDQGDFTILACLKENRPKLSTACRQVLIGHGQ